MQKEKGIVSIKVKLLGVIVPVVIVSILVLVLIAYRTSAGLILGIALNQPCRRARTDRLPHVGRAD